MNLTEALSLLELEYGFSEQDLKAAYRKMARKYHPDIIGDASNEKMAQINAAYDICRAQIGKMKAAQSYSGPDLVEAMMKKYGQMFRGYFNQKQR